MNVFLFVRKGILKLCYGFEDFQISNRIIMRIDHIAIWVNDLEKMLSFYVKYFNGMANEKYRNEKQQFESYFIGFESGSRIELMKKPGIGDNQQSYDHQRMGIVHLAFSAGSREAVDSLTNLLKAAGYTVAGEPRITGDGYYESVILDPEGNIVEITD